MNIGIDVAFSVMHDVQDAKNIVWPVDVRYGFMPPEVDVN